MATPVSVQAPEDPGPSPKATKTNKKSGGSRRQDSPRSSVTEATPPADGEPHYQWVRPARLVRNADQPRQQFDEQGLQRLAQSLADHGVMQPIMVRLAPGADPDAEEPALEIVAGERRWRAATLAKLETVPVLVQAIDDRQAAEWALVENLQREDLNPIDRASAFQRLGDAFGLAHEEIAERVGLDRSTITNHLRLLSLDAEVQTLVSNQLLSMGHARALAGLDDADDQRALAARVVKDQWSVRQTEAAVQRAKTGVAADSGSAGPSKARVKAAWIGDLEQQLTEALDRKVQIKAGRKKGAGTLMLDYSSVDDFDALVNRLGIRTQ